MELASHVLRGNQVVVRGSDVTTVTSIINVIKVGVCLCACVCVCVCVCV